MARTYNTILNKVAIIGMLLLILILVEMLSAFHHWVDVGCGSVIYGSYYVLVSSLSIVDHKCMLNFDKSFSTSIEIMKFFPIC